MALNTDSIKKLNEMMKKISDDIFEKFQSCSYEVSYDKDKDDKLQIDFNGKTGTEENYNAILSHIGLYGIVIEKEEKSALAYIGKTEDGIRVREHLTGKNKNGTPLIDNAMRQHQNIKKAIQKGFKVKITTYFNETFKNLV